MTAPAHGVSLGQATKVWLRIGLLSFGGPAGQIATMHRELVEQRKWIGERRFLHALNYCMLLPGPEAQQLATYIGWLMHRTLGGVIAGTLFVLPGFIAIMGLSIVYATYRDTSLVNAIFYGMKPVVLAVVVEALLRISRRALANATMVMLAALAFIAIFFLDVPFPLIVLAAGIAGYVGGRFAPNQFVAGGGHAAKGEAAESSLLGEEVPEHAKPSARRALLLTLVFAILWGVPVFGLAAWLGGDATFSQIASFFSKMAVVTFGGAYAVLAYVAQAAVESYAWLRPGEMVDGLALAETTPGPLILVLQYVGFIAAFRDPGGLSPLLAGILGGTLTVWVTFVPCFLWIFLGAPYIEALRGQRLLSTALSAITASVVGVILNLALWFALHVIFAQVAERHIGPLRLWTPQWASIDVVSAGMAIVAMVLVIRFHVGMLSLLAGGAICGLLIKLAL